MGQSWDNARVYPSGSSGSERDKNRGLEPNLALRRATLNMTMMLAPQKAAT
jgi:hypothetical protein